MAALPVRDEGGFRDVDQPLYLFDLPFEISFKVAPSLQTALLLRELRVAANHVEICGHQLFALSTTRRKWHSHGKLIMRRTRGVSPSDESFG